MPAKIAHVQVHLDFTKNPPFHLTSSDLPIGPDGELIFRNCHHPGFHVHFELQDPTNGFLFPSNSQKDDAVYSQMGSIKSCPSSNPSSPQDVVFRPIRVTPDRKTLVVHNPNDGALVGTFAYNLRVTDGTTWKDLDPGGDNMNGPVSRFFDASAFLVGVGGGLATAAVLGGLVYLSGLQLVMR